MMTPFGQSVRQNVNLELVVSYLMTYIIIHNLDPRLTAAVKRRLFVSRENKLPPEYQDMKNWVAFIPFKRIKPSLSDLCKRTLKYLIRYADETEKLQLYYEALYHIVNNPSIETSDNHDELMTEVLSSFKFDHPKKMKELKMILIGLRGDIQGEHFVEDIDLQEDIISLLYVCPFC